MVIFQQQNKPVVVAAYSEIVKYMICLEQHTQPFNSPLYRTTWVSRYQKKPSPNQPMKKRRMICTDNKHTQTRLMALFPGLPGWASTRKVKPILILLKRETVSGSGVSWAVCKSASRSRQITMPVPHHSFFTGWMPFLPPHQQRQSTEGILHRQQCPLHKGSSPLQCFEPVRFVRSN